MGDHRVTIDFKIEMHGVKREFRGWRNWSETIKDEVSEFMEKFEADAMQAYYDAEMDAVAVEEAFAEKREREELDRLKQKYEKGA